MSLKGKIVSQVMFNFIVDTTGVPKIYFLNCLMYLCKFLMKYIIIETEKYLFNQY